MAASEAGPIYEGAFGVRCLDGGPAMTLDTVFRIVSMTKAITSSRRCSWSSAASSRLDAPVPAMRAGARRAAGADRLRRGRQAAAAPGQAADHPEAPDDPHRRVQLRDLERATSARYVEATGMPPICRGKLAALRQPLGVRSRRAMGIRHQHRLGRPPRRGGQRPEARRLLREHIFAPLGMKDTGFAPTPEQHARQASRASAPGRRQRSSRSR